MPTARITSDLEMYYEVDDFAEPWRKHETVLLAHGNAESSAVWYGWMPRLAGELRVVRPDMRGFGRSTPMPVDYAWSASRIADDYIELMDQLGIERFHLVGAKVGGTMALHLAARHPSRIKTLTVLRSSSRGIDSMPRYQSWLSMIKQDGVEGWARDTMAGRLGADFPAAGVEWWIKLMGRTAASTQLGFIGAAAGIDVTPDLPNIRCPTLVITAAANPLIAIDSLRAWQQKIPESSLVTLPGDGYHIAATAPERCAAQVLEFIKSSSQD